MIRLDVRLYGPLARYGGDPNERRHAALNLEVPEGTTMRALLARLGMPLAEKGITFINGNLTDTPGLLADIDRELQDGDRVALFHELSMWPFQYRLGAPVGSELKGVMQSRDDGGIYHTSRGLEKGEEEP